jgi:hypothetical protein
MSAGRGRRADAGGYPIQPLRRKRREGRAYLHSRPPVRRRFRGKALKPDLPILSPRNFARNSGYSCEHGLLLQGVTDVCLVEPAARNRQSMAGT